jgi:hypothetical protein
MTQSALAGPGEARGIFAPDIGAAWVASSGLCALLHRGQGMGPAKVHRNQESDALALKGISGQ